MKNYIILFVLSIGMSYTYANINVEHSKNTLQPKGSITTRAGDCVKGNTQIDLNINNVRTRLSTTNNLWNDAGSKAFYNAPKLSDDQIASGVQPTNALFIGSIWLSGKDGAILKSAFSRNDGGSSPCFWPGPLIQGSQISKDRCNRFDNMWKVNKIDIDAFLKDSTQISNDMKYWPGKGNVNLLTRGFTADDILEDLAPFFDKNNDGIYNPADGDYPAIKNRSAATHSKGVVADQMIFWVVNDAGNAHTVSTSGSMGVQLNCLAFAFQTSDEINNMTFYTYNIINKSSVKYSESYISQFVDPDMGNYNDDMIGCDPKRDLGYCYNGDAYDENITGAQGYLSKVPVVGVDFFEGPKENGITARMSSFSYFVNSDPKLNDPSLETEFRNLQEGKTTKGQNFTSGGDCISGTVSTKFCFPGNPSNSSEWSYCSAGLPGRDVRFVQSSGPFTFYPGVSQIITLGNVFVQPSEGSYQGCQIDFTDNLFAADDKAQLLFDSDFEIIEGPNAPDLAIKSLSNQFQVTINDNSFSNNFGQNFNKRNALIPKSLGSGDTSFKFEGYLVYQVLTPNVSFSDLSDGTVAKLVKEIDVKNNVKGLIANYTRKNVNGQVIDVIDKSLNLSNEGITKSFTITEDYFQQEGVKNLVNNKKYYYATVAFAYNNYIDPTALNPYQRTKLLFSNQVNVYSATPMNSSYTGYKDNATFMEGIPVKRIQGIGHGSYFLDLDSASIIEILTNSSMDEVTYKGGYTPISVRVNDPAKLKNKTFTLTIIDTAIANKTSKVFPSAYWELDVNNGEDLIRSEATVDRFLEQKVVGNQDYGISIALSSLEAVSTNHSKTYNPAVYNYIDAKINFSKPDSNWLSFIKHTEGKDYYDWIRSGTFTIDKYYSAFNTVNGKKYFTDSARLFNKVLSGTVAPYCLAANNNSSDYPADITKVYSSFGPGFKWKNIGSHYTVDRNQNEPPFNNLDTLNSVDIVVTNDKNKWSRCVVLETGENPNYNEFNAVKGQIRKAPSKDIDGNDDPTDLGRSYFPGYAINVETGQRVNIYFGENSRFKGVNGANMIWDPSADTVTSLGDPVLGGGHYVYITNSLYDEGTADQITLLSEFNKDVNGAPINIATLNSQTNNTVLSSKVANIYKSFMWTFMPVMTPNFDLYKTGSYKIPNTVTMKIRVQKPYGFYINPSDRALKYEFSTNELVSVKDVVSAQKEALEKVRVVPNPYNAYAIYEQTSIQNLVKIVDIPLKATVTIYTIDGVLIRTLKQDNSSVDNFNYGVNQTKSEIGYENAMTWDLRSTNGTLIGSGVYLIRVDAPGIGVKTVKLFATMRSPDVSNF